MTPFPSQTLTNIDYIVELLQKAKHAVVLTGAGISTPSGIPDFRSEGTGLWSRDEPMEVASLNTFRTDPERFFVWFRPLASLIFNAKPNPAHIALAKLEKAEHIHSIITQNIDGLHQKAGAHNVIEMHGTLRMLSCTQCFHQAEALPYLKAFVEQGILPRCSKCGGLMKPNVILFGEQLPQQAWYAAQRESRQCDLMLVVGSSLEVLPVAGLPMQAIDRGAHLVILNDTATYINVRADVVVKEDVAEVLPAIVEQVLNG
ncbi:MAG: NAD-dependent deacetylase [Anaerolineales bacterium]